MSSDEEMSAIVAQIELKPIEPNSLNQSNCSSHEAIDREIDEFEKVMKSQLQKLSDIKVQRIKARVESQNGSTQVMDNIKEKSASRMKSLDEFNSKVDSFAVEIRCEEKAGLKYVESIDELNTEKTQQLMNHLNDINTKNTNLPNLSKELIESRKEVLTQKVSEINKMIDDSIKLCDKQLTAKQTTLRSFEESYTQGFGEQKELVSNIAQNMSQITECVTNMTSEMVQMSQTMEKSQIREIRRILNSREGVQKGRLRSGSKYQNFLDFCKTKKFFDFYLDNSIFIESFLKIF